MFIFQVCVDVCVVHHLWHDGVPGGLLLLPSQRGGVGVATGVSNRYVGIGVVTYTSHRSPEGLLGGQRRMRKAMLHLTTGHRSFGSFHGLILFMSIWMCSWKISGDKYSGVSIGSLPVN